MQAVTPEFKAALLRISNDIIYAESIAPEVAAVGETLATLRNLAAYAVWAATGESIDE